MQYKDDCSTEYVSRRTYALALPISKFIFGLYTTSAVTVIYSNSAATSLFELAPSNSLMDLSRHGICRGITVAILSSTNAKALYIATTRHRKRLHQKALCLETANIASIRAGLAPV